MSSGLMSAARLVKSTPRLLNAETEPWGVGRQLLRVEGLVVDRQAVDDHERLVARRDRADAADGDRRGGARDARGRGDLDAGDAALQRVEEVLALRLRDLRPGHRLLRRADAPLVGRLAEGRDDHRVELARHALERDVDHEVGGDGPLDRRMADEAVLEDLPDPRADRVVALPVRQDAGRRAADDDLHAGHAGARLVRHLAGDRLLLGADGRDQEGYSCQRQEYSLHHVVVYRVTVNDKDGCLDRIAGRGPDRNHMV
jgi:hypothetical protein